MTGVFKVHSQRVFRRSVVKQYGQILVLSKTTLLYNDPLYPTAGQLFYPSMKQHAGPVGCSCALEL